MYYFLDFRNNHIPQEYEGVVVSDWFLNNIECIDGRNVLAIEAPFITRDSFAEATKKCFGITDRLCEAVSKWLNCRYNIEFTPKQVGYIYGSFFDKHVYIIYERYARLKNLDAKHLFYEIPADDVTWISSGNLKEERYNAFIYGRILAHMGANEISNSSVASVDKRNEAVESISGRFTNCLSDFLRYPNRIGYNLRRINGFRHLFKKPPKKQISCKSLLIRSFIPKEIEKGIIDESNGAVYSLDPNILIRIGMENYIIREMDYELRKGVLEGFIPENDFEKIVKDIISELLPLSLCENFYSTYIGVEPIANRFSVEKVYSAALYHGAVSIFAAIKSRSGAKIIDIQHGGAYLPNMAIGFSEAHLFDDFITWGDYGTYPYGNVRAVAPVRITNERKIDSSIGKTIRKILLLSNDPNTYDIGDGAYDYCFISKHFSFVSNLPIEYRKKLIVRLRNDELGLADIYKNKFPEVELQYENDCSLSASLNKCNLVVADMNSTVYYEALLAGKPTLLFDGIKYIVTCDRMQKWLMELKKADIYSEKGEDIARLVVRKGNEIITMWNNQNIQKLIEEFLTFAMSTDVSVREEWTKELNM